MNQQKLHQEDKETIVRAIAFYYENHVWTDLLSKDHAESSDKANDEDYRLRSVTNKLGLNLPTEILQRL
ncbi:hypothetical protein [Sporosarcina sp. SG10008]|uniref:hypothetical protein n=1 Tax=Sporosarcina sp. SG10008 TaxID=3373103 RepID=UPI0037DC1DD1